MEKKKRSFKQLKIELTFAKFNTFCKEVAEQYATSENEFARSWFCEHYNISKSCFYRVLEHAAVTNLVDEEIFKKMREKALKNQKAHAEGAGVTTLEKYARIYQKRCEYIAMSFVKDDIIKFATDFADNPDISKQDLSVVYEIPTKAADLILVSAIENSIINDVVVDAIERRSINNAETSKKEITKQFFKALRKKREANKKGFTIE